MKRSTTLEKLLTLNLILGTVDLVMLRTLWCRERRYKVPNQLSGQEDFLLQLAGNTGMSPAAGFVMHLYRTGQLSGESSVLSGKSLMGANWGRVVLFEANLRCIDLSYAILDDIELRGADLSEGRFQWASLKSANLARTKLRKADLTRVKAMKSSFFMAYAQRSIFQRGNFDQADFQEADFHGAKLNTARLTQVNMRDTNLAEADLRGAVLTGARMIRTNLRGANLAYARFDESTILPDAEFIPERNSFDKYWTPQTDMTRYTNPDHPDFWQPEWAMKYDWVKQNYNED